MSLPYYEPTKYDYKIKEKGPPPNYEELVPILSQRELTFYILDWAKCVLCFTSQDAVTKYLSFKRVNKKNANFKHVINLQKLGIGLPLMEAEFKRCPGLGETKFATIFKCVPPPPDSNRTFNKETDKFEFCTVRKKRDWHHTRYTFTILPNNRSNTFTFSMFVHSKLPIIDVSPIRGSPRRYRWFITDSRRHARESYTYELFVLDEKQKSMVDNMEVANQKLDKTNSVLNDALCELPIKKVKEYMSMGKWDELLELHENDRARYLPNDKVGELTRDAYRKITMTTFQEGNKLLHVSQSQHVNESINSVSVHELALTCMTCVINYIEDSKRRLEW